MQSLAQSSEIANWRQWFPLGRTCLAVSLTGVATVVFLPVQPEFVHCLSGCVAVLVIAMVSTGGACHWCGRAVFDGMWRLMLIVACGALSILMTAWRVDVRIADALHPDDVDKVSRVEVRIVGLVQESPRSRSVEAQVLSSVPSGVPSRIQLSWMAPGWQGPYAKDAPPAEFPALLPGQVWRMALNLRPPSGARNPHGFDYEQYAFARGIRALGSVRGKPVLLHDDPYYSVEIMAQRVRYIVRERMRAYLQNMRYGPVLLALAIGDQAGVQAQDWQVFNRSGITHLVSISGSHITMIAAVGGMLTLWVWRRLRVNAVAVAERMPARVCAAMAALLVAWLYCLLAGWGVPARRTFLMLAIIAVAYVLRLQLGASRILLLAAWLVVWMDPWSLMSSGFWLSFGAVGILMLYGNRVMDVDTRALPRWKQWREAMRHASGLQLAVSFALLPILGRLFHEVSLVSPLANAYAIPAIGFVITPLALLLAAAAMTPGGDVVAAQLAWVGHALLEWMMLPTEALALFPAASIATAAVPWWVTLLACAGVCMALWPHGYRFRKAGWLLLLPATLWRVERPDNGEWLMTALDVGQGSAILIETRRHSFLFDTGVRRSVENDEGARTVVPYLKARGIRELDALIISHEDLDHVGGTASVLQSVPVLQSYASFDLNRWLQREERLLNMPDLSVPRPQAMTQCRYGTQWNVDGVHFTMLWPPVNATVPELALKEPHKPDSNADSCVLLVQGTQYSLLLTGDIGVSEERMLVERGIKPIDIVVAGHHGSRTSSSEALVQSAQAKHVVIQAGMWNRFGHPHAAVVRRWERVGASVWRTDLDGAIRVSAAKDRLAVTAQRVVNPAYWLR